MAMKFKTIPAPEILKNDVECFRIAEYTGEQGLVINVCLSGLPGIIFQHHEGRSPIDNIRTSSRCNCCIPTSYICGQTTEPGVLTHKKGPYTMTQVILKPHALNSLLGLNASALTNCGLMELNEFAADDLNMQLIEATNEQEQVALLTRFLVSQRKRERTRDTLVEEGLRLIHKN